MSQVADVVEKNQSVQVVVVGVVAVVVASSLVQ